MSKLQHVIAQTVPPGIYRFSGRATASRLGKEAQRAGWLLYVLDGNKTRDKPSFLQEIARVMNFPSYFGKNWDALNDCLTDMEWSRGQGYIVLFRGPGKLLETSPQDWDVAMEIFQDAIKFWHGVGVPFYVLLQGGTATSFPEI